MGQLPLFQPGEMTPSLTVTELTRYLRGLLEGDGALKDLWVQGEVSNFSRPSSGHLYFTLKDSSAALRCVMWRTSAVRQSFLPADGAAVEAHGYISIYEAGGQYQLYADLVRPLGEGLLYQEFMRLKARLEAEGLFDPARKRPIPLWPRRIGVVTSATGAALQDMLKTFRRRYPLVEIILAPAPVQGDEAPPRIIAALQSLNQIARADVILLARGGGSIEDLWAFNDEALARAIAASEAPVVTGIGHETDFTIADFVADLRAPTPTAAAELATPDQTELQAMQADLTQRLKRAAQAVLARRQWALNDLKSRLTLYSPLSRLLSDRQRLDELTYRITTALRHCLALQRIQIKGLTQRLVSLNPVTVLERGFALVTTMQGALVSSVEQAKPGDRLNVRLKDGTFRVQVLNGREDLRKNQE